MMMMMMMIGQPTRTTQSSIPPGRQMSRKPLNGRIYGYV